MNKYVLIHIQNLIMICCLRVSLYFQASQYFNNQYCALFRKQRYFSKEFAHFFKPVLSKTFFSILPSNNSLLMKKNNTKAVEIIKQRLYWLSDDEPPKNIAKSFYFNIDNDLVYDNFNEDFGPLNLGKTWKYVTQLQKLINHAEYKNNQIYHYTSTRYDKAANSAYLMCAFQVIVLGIDADTACEPFKSMDLRPFRDAGYGQCSYKCTDCVRGLEYAIKIGWFNYKKFNLAEYEHYEKLQNGDLNWIIPQKFVAFSSPSDKNEDKYGNRTFTPNDYVPIFKKLGVTTVVRLNNRTYDSEDFKKRGIKHLQLYFPDGSVPSLEIVHRFVQLAEDTEGALAVHCKAGLGRTGSLIACYAMKHYYFPAAAFIGWIRIARPGSILGPQQNYLLQMQNSMRKQGEKSPIWKRIRPFVDQKQILTRMKNLSINEMNQRQLYIWKNGEKGQGQNLMSAKLKKETSNKANHSKQHSYSSRSNSNSGRGSPNDRKK